jgi:hypothetical protein
LAGGGGGVDLDNRFQDWAIGRASQIPTVYAPPNAGRGRGNYMEAATLVGEPAPQRIVHSLRHLPIFVYIYVTFRLYKN